MAQPPAGRRRLKIVLGAVLSPLFLVLFGLVLFGELAPAPALVAFAVGFVIMALILRGHANDMAALEAWLSALVRGADGPPPELGHALTAEGLGRTLRRLDTAWRRRQEEFVQLSSSTTAGVDALPDPLIVLDGNRRVVRTNPAARRLLGRGLAGQDLALVLRNPEVLEAADRVLAAGGAEAIEFSLAVPVERDLIAHVVRLEGPAADGTAAVVALHDLTAIKRSEQQRADFVANASHELRTPLSVLTGCIETLRGPAKDDTKAQERFLATMSGQASRMIRLVEDLLALSRIELEEHSAPHEEVDLPLLLRRMAEMMDVRARSRDVNIALEIEPELPALLGDDHQLNQVFQNLVDNAIKYGGEGRTVHVAARRASGRRPPGLPSDAEVIAVTVRDEGEGIPEEHLPRLTERFYRIDTARSRELGGTGLGLAIVKHIVNRHRGVLAIDSTLGKGSEFTVYLPARPATDDVEAP